MHCATFLLAESLCLSQSFRWFWALLVTEFDECLLYHLCHCQILSLIVHIVVVIYISKKVRTTLTCHHLLIIIVYFLTESLFACICMASWALPESVIYLVAIVNFGEGIIRSIMVLVHIVQFVYIKCVYKRVLSWTNLIHIGRLHYWWWYHI
jgi:hypothetical protein